jgi:hypothetical protein
MHSLDFHALIFHRPLWDAIVLPLMIGGIISSFTGVWLLIRRVKRISVGQSPKSGDRSTVIAAIPATATGRGEVEGRP